MEKNRFVHSLFTGMCVKRGAGYGLFEFSDFIFLSSADFGCYRFYWPLPLSRGGCRREVSIRVNVWNVCRDEKSWPLWKGGHCMEVAVSRGSTTNFFISHRREVFIMWHVRISEDNPTISEDFQKLLRTCQRIPKF